MHQASVGWHCPSCVRSAAKQNAPAQRAVRVALAGHRPIVTQLIMAVCGAVMLWDVTQGAGLTSGRGSVAAEELSLWAPAVKFDGEWYRVITSGFTHRGLVHVGMNMYILWMIGRQLEGRYGSLTFAALYGTGILGGSLGAMLVEPQASVVGASGAVFALMGVLVVMQQMAGVRVFDSGLGRMLALNMIITFAVPGISIGGHIGGLVIGGLCGYLLAKAAKMGRKAKAMAPLVIAGVGLATFLAIIPAIERAANQFI